MRRIYGSWAFWAGVSGCWVVLASMLSGCITEAQFLPFRNTLFQLEKDSEQIHEKLTKLDQDTRDALSAMREDQANIKADMVDLHTEMQEVMGEVSLDQHQKDIKKREEKAVEETVVLQLSHLQKKVKTYEERMMHLEELLAVKRSGGSSPGVGRKEITKPRPDAGKKAPGKAAVKKIESPEDAYEKAYNTYKAGKYMDSRKAFTQFVRNYPDSKLLNNAIFWIGETYYRFGDYYNAILKYQDVVDKHPKGAKAPDALLKMGFAYEMSGETKAALASLEKLTKEYPGASQVKLAKKKIQQLQKKKTESEKDRGNDVKQKPKKSVTEKKPPK